MSDSKVTQVNVYRSAGQWCYAAWAGAEFDCSGTLDVLDSATEDEAMVEARQQWHGATVSRVADVGAKAPR